MLARLYGGWYLMSARHAVVKRDGGARKREFRTLAPPPELLRVGIAMIERYSDCVGIARYYGDCRYGDCCYGDYVMGTVAMVTTSW